MGEADLERRLSENFEVQSSQVFDSDWHGIGPVAGVFPGLGHQCVEMLGAHPVLRELLIQAQPRQEGLHEGDGNLVCFNVGELNYFKPSGLSYTSVYPRTARTTELQAGHQAEGIGQSMVHSANGRQRVRQ